MLKLKAGISVLLILVSPVPSFTGTKCFVSSKFSQYQPEYKPCEQAVLHAEYFAVSLRKHDRREGFAPSSVNTLVNGAPVKKLLKMRCLKHGDGFKQMNKQTNPQGDSQPE